MSAVTTGCKTTSETVGAVVGGIGGAAASYGITSALGGGSTTAAIASVGGGLAGAYLGSEIGRLLDEADREKAEAASAKAVTTGKTGQSVQWKSDKNPNVYGRTKVVDTGTIASTSSSAEPTVTWQRSQKREPIRTAPKSAAAEPRITTPAKAPSTPAMQTASATQPSARQQPAPPPSAPTQTAAVEPAANKTCKKVDEVAYINGKETRQQRVFCQTASGGWAPVTV